MATDVKRDETTGAVDQVQLDEVIKPGDPRWGIHNPESGERDTLSVHEEPSADTAVQVDIPQSEPVPSDELYRVAPDEQPSQQAAAAEADEKKSSSSKSSDKS